MYTDEDIEAAVRAGAIPPAAALALRAHVEGAAAAPAPDEEPFRLLTGFNDIFVSIAAVLMLVAVGWIGGAVWPPLAPAAVAAAAWGLAEYFTRQRRMALPSILLLLAFVGGVAATLATVILATGDTVEWLNGLETDEARLTAGALIASGVAALTAAAARLHWRRFMVTMTVAAGAVAVVVVAMSLILGLVPGADGFVFPITLAFGIALFAFAMRWDASDRTRMTRRSDVAFWLHLAAAPMIAHPVFNMLGVFSGDIGAGTAVVVLALYALFTLVALAIDRRALLVSSLAYVLFAMASLFQSAGAIELSAAFTALVIGSALLLLSAFWQRARALVVPRLGSLAERLPPVGTAPRPAMA